MYEARHDEGRLQMIAYRRILVALALVALVGTMGACAREDRTITGLDSPEPTGAPVLRAAGVTVWRQADHPNRLVVEYTRIVHRVPGGGKDRLLSWEEAEALLHDDDPAVAIKVTRVVTGRALEPGDPVLSDFPDDREFALPTSVEVGECLPCGCCPGLCDGTWGCIKCCYR